MCNRYRTDKANAALWDAVEEWTEPKDRFDEHGRNAPLPFEMFPNKPGRFFHLVEGVLTLSEGLWGMPSPAKALVTAAGKPMTYDPGVTNIRNTDSPHWRRWLAPQNRALVPITTFCEPDQVGGSGDKWFEFADGRSLGFFAGVWDEHTRQTASPNPRVKKGEPPAPIRPPVTGKFYAFLTTEANNVVGQYHRKAMPVFLPTDVDQHKWLTAPWEEAKALQRPMPDDFLRVLAMQSPDDEDLLL